MNIQIMLNKVRKMPDKVTLVFCVLEFEILYPDGISLFKPQFSQQGYAALSFYLVIEVSDGAAVCEIR